MAIKTEVTYALYVRRYAPFRSFGGGFDGDGRGFSTALDASARTVGVATFGPSPGTAVRGTGFSSGSSWVGPWEVRKTYPIGSIGHHTGQVRVSITKISADASNLSFTIYTEGNLPLKDILFHQTIANAVDRVNSALRPGSPHPQGSPDIDTFVDFRASFLNNQAVFEGNVRGDGFPNAEVFVVDAKGQTVALLDYRTKSGEAGPLHRLFGAHASNHLGFFRRQVDLMPDGTFGRNHRGVPMVIQES